MSGFYGARCAEVATSSWPLFLWGGHKSAVAWISCSTMPPICSQNWARDSGFWMRGGSDMSLPPKPNSFSLIFCCRRWNRLPRRCHEAGDLGTLSQPDDGTWDALKLDCLTESPIKGIPDDVKEHMGEHCRCQAILPEKPAEDDTPISGVPFWSN